MHLMRALRWLEEYLLPHCILYELEPVRLLSVTGSGFRGNRQLLASGPSGFSETGQFMGMFGSASASVFRWEKPEAEPIGWLFRWFSLKARSRLNMWKPKVESRSWEVPPAASPALRFENTLKTSGVITRSVPSTYSGVPSQGFGFVEE